MRTFPATIGETTDIVTLKLGNSELFLAKSYWTIGGVFDVPAGYNVTLGIPADKLSAVLQVTRPRTTCELAIDGNVQFRGFIDSRAPQTSEQGTTLTLSGRDQLEELFDCYITAERTFTDITIVELVRHYMDEVYGVGGYELQYNADVARRMMIGDSTTPVAKPGGVTIALPTLSGNQITLGQLSDPDAVTLVVPVKAVADVNARRQQSRSDFAAKAKAKGASFQNEGEIDVAYEAAAKADYEAALTYLKSQAAAFAKIPGPPPKPTVTAKIGERVFDGLLKPELDRAGYFLWSAGPGIFVLAAPNVTQPPVTRIVRRLNGRNEGSRVISGGLKEDTVRRYTSITVHAKAGSGAKSRAFKDGTAVDLEMMELGYSRPMAIQDAKCKTDEQAQFLANRKLAESRRASWSLTYVVAGHSTPGLNGGRLTWAFDTMVEVVDEILGIEGVFYVDTVEHSGTPQKTTKLKLMRPADALFGDGSGRPADQ